MTREITFAQAIGGLRAAQQGKEHMTVLILQELTGLYSESTRRLTEVHHHRGSEAFELSLTFEGPGGSEDMLAFEEAAVASIRYEAVHMGGNAGFRFAFASGTMLELGLTDDAAMLAAVEGAA